jgi:hypothetical protein
LWSIVNYVVPLAKNVKQQATEKLSKRQSLNNFENKIKNDIALRRLFNQNILYAKFIRNGEENHIRLDNRKYKDLKILS